MVKVLIEDIKSSYYDDKKNTLHIRKSALSDPEDLKKVLEHELPHYYFRRSRWKNFLYEYNYIWKGVLFLFLTWFFVFAWQNYTTYHQLQDCILSQQISTNPFFNTSLINENLDFNISKMPLNQT
jgi:hypothetical protein